MPKALSGLCLALALLAWSCGGSSTTATTTGGDFYRGKTVTIIVPNAPGGPMDAAARLVAPYLAKHLGATVNVDTVKGAGGVIGLNKLAAAPPDGLTIGFTSVPTALLSSLVGTSGVNYDGTRFVYLGRLSTEPRVLLASKSSGIKSLADLQARSQPVKYPTQGFDDDFYTMAALGSTLKFTPRYITGFGSQGEANQSIIVGSTDVTIGGLDALQPLITSGDAVPLVVIADKRLSEYPKVPTWLESATSSQKSIVTPFNDMIGLERSFFAPPGFNSAATSAMRAGLDQTLHDADLVSRAKAQRLPIVFLSGSDEQKQVELIHNASSAIVPIVKQARAQVEH